MTQTAAKTDRIFYCECCGRTLNADRMTWLALDAGTGLFSKGGTPELESQGWFAFGKACAKAVLKNNGGGAA